MNRGFAGNFIAVSIVHVIALLAITIAGVIPSCRSRKPHAVKRMPVRIVSGVPAGAKPSGNPAPPPAVSRPPEPAPRPATPSRPKPLKPVPVKPPTKKPVKPARTAKPLARRPDTTRTIRRPVMTKEQIENELMNTAEAASTPSVVSPVSMPGDTQGEATQEDLYLAMIWQTFYDAWLQPSYTDVGDAVASVTIELALDGAVTDRRLTKSSGNKTLDTSAMQAAASVQKIPGLSRDFIEDNGEIVVQFKVEE